MVSPFDRDSRQKSVSSAQPGLYEHSTVRPSLSASSSQFQFSDWLQIDKESTPFPAMSPPLPATSSGRTLRAGEREISPLSFANSTGSASVESGRSTRAAGGLGYGRASQARKEGPPRELRSIPQTRQSAHNRSLGYTIAQESNVPLRSSHQPIPIAAASTSKIPDSTATALATTRVTRSRRASSHNVPSSGTNQSEAAALNLLSLALPSAASASGSVIAFGGDEEPEPESDASSAHQPDEKAGGDIYRHFTNFYRDGPSPNFLVESPSYEWRSDSAMTADVLPHFDASPNHHWSFYHSSQSTNPSSQSVSSRRNSISSSVGTSMSTQRVRQHRPARTQRAVSEASFNSLELEYGKRRSQRTAAKVVPVSTTSTSQRTLVGSSQQVVNRNGKRPLSPANSRSRPVRASSRLSTAGMSSPVIAALPLPPVKRHKPASTPAPPSPVVALPPRRPSRTLPPLTTTSTRTIPNVEIHSNFARLYRDFPLSSAIPPSSPFYAVPHPTAPIASSSTAVAPPSTTMDLPDGAKWNAASAEPTNLYHPRFVVGTSDEKAGACPICIEPVERGGEGVTKWLKVSSLILSRQSVAEALRYWQLKNSAYSYHMSYAHGISNVTGLPFSPPTEIRNGEIHYSFSFVPLLTLVDSRTQEGSSRWPHYDD